MTPAEMHAALLEEARWWANQPAHSGSAHGWVTFFEQLPEDDPLLVMLAGEDADADATGPAILELINSRCGT